MSFETDDIQVLLTHALLMMEEIDGHSRQDYEKLSSAYELVHRANTLYAADGEPSPLSRRTLKYLTWFRTKMLIDICNNVAKRRLSREK